MLIYISYLKYKKNRIKLLPLRFVTYRKEQTNTEHVESHQGITETHRADINSSTNKDYLSAVETWALNMWYQDQLKAIFLINFNERCTSIKKSKSG